MNLSLTLALLAACSHPDAPRPVEPRRDPDPDLFSGTDIASTITYRAGGRSYRPPVEPPVLPDPLRLVCPVCGAAVGVRCEPKRLGKAGRRGAVAHRERR